MARRTRRLVRILAAHIVAVSLTTLFPSPPPRPATALGHLMENINKGLLHRAFSAFVFRPSDGKLLLQQRATEKITFPDMWTNTCCSHPLDDFAAEREEAGQLGVRVAASRKLEHELGIPPAQTPVDGFQYLTRIHYLAPSDGLWGEHEVDYILFMTGDVSVTPNLNEIRDYKYVDKAELQAMFEDSGKRALPCAPPFCAHPVHMHVLP